MSKRHATLGDQIRQAVKAAPMSRNALCAAAGIDKGSFSRFMAGKVGLSLPSLDALSRVLDLRIVAGGQETLATAATAGKKRARMPQERRSTGKPTRRPSGKDK
jgi:transcriptional regulator with XRE-family HTH domain